MTDALSTLDDATVLALAVLTARMRLPDAPRTFGLAEARAYLASAGIGPWSFHEEDAVHTLSGRVDGVDPSLIYEDVDYPHLFDPHEYVEAFAHDIEDAGERCVTVIHVGDTYAFRLRMRGRDAGCSAEVALACIVDQDVCAVVGLWERQVTGEVVARAAALLGALPAQAGRRALLQLQADLARRPGWAHA